MNINLRTAQGWQDLKTTLDDRIGDVLAMCGLDLPAKGGWSLFDDPRGDGRDCFGIFMGGDGMSWKKFNGTEKGRALELIAYYFGWYHLQDRGAKEAAHLAMQRLGLAHVSAEQLAKDRASAQIRQAKAKDEQKARRERTAAAAFAIFVGAKPVVWEQEGYQSAAYRYLKHRRGIDLRDAPFVGPRGGDLTPGSLRFAPRHRYVIRDKKDNKTGEHFAPALIACCADADGQIKAVHQTWLQPDGSDKAAIPPAPDGREQPARKVLGEFAGLVIPLWRGDGHLSVKDACANGLLQTLILTEGVEDGLSALMAAPQHRVWAMISLSNMANVAARLPDCIDAVIVHRQNDWDKPSAVAAFDSGIAALRATGRMVAEVEASDGKDLNDTLRGEN